MWRQGKSLAYMHSTQLAESGEGENERIGKMEFHTYHAASIR